MADNVDECTDEQLRTIRQIEQADLGVVPFNAQQTANDEAAVWSAQWQSGFDAEPIVWPDDMDEHHRKLELTDVSRLRKGVGEFPC